MSNELSTDIKIVEINKELKPIIEIGEKIKIENQEGMIEATELLKKVIDKKKNIEAERVSIVKPLNDQVKFINDKFKAIIQPLELLESAIKGKMLDYRKIEAEKIRKQQEKEEAREKAEFEAEQKRLLDEAKNIKDKEVKKEIVRDIKKEEFVYTPTVTQSSNVKSSFGTFIAKKVKKFEIIDVILLPREYLIPNETKIRKAVNDGYNNIPGLRIWEEEQASLR
jgi:hypothetical protein